jgi:hypothetical protein
MALLRLEQATPPPRPPFPSLLDSHTCRRLLLMPDVVLGLLCARNIMVKPWDTHAHLRSVCAGKGSKGMWWEGAHVSQIATLRLPSVAPGVEVFVLASAPASPVVTNKSLRTRVQGDDSATQKQHAHGKNADVLEGTGAGTSPIQPCTMRCEASTFSPMVCTLWAHDAT